MEYYHWLILLGVICVIAEVFTPGFIAGCLAIGFFLAAIASYFSLSIEWQIAIFSIGVLISFFSIRPFMLRYGYKTGNKVHTNRDGIIGKTAVVVETIDNSQNKGLIKIDGDTWSARSLDNTLLPAGSNVIVDQIESIILYVKPVNH
jgi:membrane protein implicated in regulation of membrane protease activity